MEIVKLRESRELMEKAAAWFALKWGIPVEAYRESMRECIGKKTSVPQWYLVLSEQNEIIAGAGIIENDFHDRKDLTPNLCALFVEEAFRKRGIAGELLQLIRNDMAAMGIKTLYLVTDHTAFYERYGWEFYAVVKDSEGVPERMYVISDGGYTQQSGAD